MPKNNPPKQFCEWSFEQGDRKWQQNEQEHEFELRDDFFWRKTKWMGAGISGGGHVGPTRQGACPPPLWLAGVVPWCVLSARNSQIFYKKSY